METLNMAESDHSFEKIIENAYWQFDAKRNGANAQPPVSERDAFKQVCRGLVNTAIDILEQIELDQKDERD